MKKIIHIIILISVFISANAQTINWNSFTTDQHNLIYLNTGYHYGLTTQIGYGHSFKSFRPLLFNIDYSFPMGDNLIDDFKVRYGGRIIIPVNNHFKTTIKKLNKFAENSDYGMETFKYKILITIFDAIQHVAK